MNPKNPLTDEPLTDKQVKALDDLRTVKTNAKKDARSGNPAKRVPALQALARIPSFVRRVYLQGVR